MGNTKSYSLNEAQAGSKKNKKDVEPCVRSSSIEQHVDTNDDVFDDVTPPPDVTDAVAATAATAKGLSRSEFDAKLRSVSPDEHVTADDVALLLNDCFCSENGSNFNEEQCKMMMSSLDDDDVSNREKLDADESWLLYQQLLKLQELYVRLGPNELIELNAESVSEVLQIVGADWDSMTSVESIDVFYIDKKQTVYFPSFVVFATKLKTMKDTLIKDHPRDGTKEDFTVDEELAMAVYFVEDSS